MSKHYETWEELEVRARKVGLKVFQEPCDGVWMCFAKDVESNRVLCEVHSSGDVALFVDGFYAGLAKLEARLLRGD